MDRRQTPLEEIAGRVGDYAPGLAAGAHAVGLDEWRRSQAAYRRQVAADRAAQARAIGAEPAANTPEDDMGNLVVAGDIYGANAAEILRALGCGTAAAEPQALSPEPLIERRDAAPQAHPLAKAALVAAGLLGGSAIAAAIPWMAGAFEGNEQQTTINQTSTTDQAPESLAVEVIRGGAQR